MKFPAGNWRYLKSQIFEGNNFLITETPKSREFSKEARKQKGFGVNGWTWTLQSTDHYISVTEIWWKLVEDAFEIKLRLLA